MKKLKTKTMLVLTAIALALIWAMVIPLWQFPDEQAHFAQVQNYAELGRSPEGRDDLSFEIYESERLLGTLRDERGNNNFTYNAGFNIEYADGYIGKDEDYLRNIDKEMRTEYVRRESPRYPPLFYYVSGLGYRAFYNSSIFGRVVGTRVVSVVIFGLIVLFGYKFASQLYPKNERLVLATTIMIGFHPMLMFVSSGINNDSLLNLFGMIILYYLVKAVREGLTYSSIFWLALTFALGALTKQLVYLLLPTILIVLAAVFLFDKKRKISMIKALIVFASGLLLMLVLVRKGGFWLPFWPRLTENSPGFSLSSFELMNQQFSRLYRETLPWYWGVYRWLSLVLPLNVIRLIKIMMGVSGVGLMAYLTEVVRRKKLSTFDWQVMVLVMANVIYFVVFLIWDNLLTRSMGFGHGIQGRYFFSLLGSHMAILVYGLWKLVEKTKLKDWFEIIILGMMTLLNGYSLYWVTKSYFVTDSFDLFVRQVSQYKPEFAKWPYIGVYFMAYLILVIMLFQAFWKGRKK
jgi:hypothetical protein